MTAPNFAPTAMFFDDSDCVEYLREDTFCIYERVDEFLTLIYDETKINVIGFKLKGFKHIFQTQLQELFKLNDERFIGLADIIEEICKEIGDQLFEDDARTRAYQAVRNIASTDNAKIYGSDLKLAA